MANLIPDLNSAGVFTLDAPFSTLITPNVPYTCIAVRKMEDITKAGGDPKAQYYDQPFGIPADRYQTDLNNGVCIVTLESPAGQVIYVPSSYILSFPKGGGIPYTTVAVAVSLSAIPKSLDLSFLTSQMTDLVMGTLGVNSTVKMLTLSADTLIDSDSHNAIEAARKAKITINETPQAAVIRLQNQVNSLTAQNTQLSNYIKANIPPKSS